MNLYQLIVIALLMVLSQKGFTQTNKRNEYFVTITDTVFCSEFIYGIINNSRIADIEYTDMKGEKVIIKGNKNMPEILTIYQNGKTTERIQLEPDRPQGPFKYITRTLSGQIKMYKNQAYLKFDNTYGRESKEYFKLPSGVAYEFNKKNINTILKPFVLLCKEVANKYGGEDKIKMNKAWEMINLYNVYCK